MKIDKNKKYQTKSGHEVRIYAVDGTEPLPIHGACREECGWVSYNWREDGRWGYVMNGRDLIECSPNFPHNLTIQERLERLEKLLER